jgi:hypothetical protein
VEAPVRNRVINRTGNGKRGTGRLKLIYEESMKRDLMYCSITKELALDRGGVEVSNSYVRTLIFGSCSFITFLC